MSLNKYILALAIALYPGISGAQRAIDLVRADVHRINSQSIDCSTPGNQNYCADRQLREIRASGTEFLRQFIGDTGINFDPNNGLPARSINGTSLNFILRPKSDGLKVGVSGDF